MTVNLPVNLELSSPPSVSSALPTAFGVRYILNKAVLGVYVRNGQNQR